MESNISVRDILWWGSEQLRVVGVDSPEQDSEVLLAYVLKKERAWLYAHQSDHIRTSSVQHFIKLVRRRARREPVAYIVGHKEFYGLDFVVNRHVLVPRPETETLVEEAIEGIRGQGLGTSNVVVIDVGTGSGAIVIAMAKQFTKPYTLYPSPYFFATDISTSALRVARANARRHGVADQITFLRGDLLEPLLVKAELWREKISALVITANLPYLPTAEWRATAPEIKKWEPRGALDGGKDGLQYYRELFQQLHSWFHNSPQPSLILREGDRSIPPLRIRGGEGALRITVLAEICPEQVGVFQKIVRGYFPRAKLSVVKDLSGRKRIVAVII